VREQHLKGVVDPLSAIMMISRNASADPCDRRIPIFDGRERFDLLFSRKGDMRVTEQAPSGQPGIAHVCGVRYLPIAGHKIETLAGSYSEGMAEQPSALINSDGRLEIFVKEASAADLLKVGKGARVEAS